MRDKIKIIPFEPYPMGVRRAENGIKVCAAFSLAAKCGIILYGKNQKTPLKIEFPDECRFGKIYSALLSGDLTEYDSYMFFEGKKIFCDPYARFVFGLEKWAKNTPDEDIRCRIDEQDFDWGSDKRPLTKYEDSFVYTLHVRGYTKSPSSGVDAKKRGTYEGLLEKISYIKSLGVTAIELMPSYEMNVIDSLKLGNGHRGGIMPEGSIVNSAGKKPLVLNEDGSIKNNHIRQKVNFWGYKKGFYFAPRTSYAYNPAYADAEFKKMVKKFHDNGIEVIMQFYFTEDESIDFINAVIRHWVYNYHIDGVHIKGNENAAGTLAKDPMLSDIKIWYYGFDYGYIYGGKYPVVRNLAQFNPEFSFAARRFLKGDDNTLSDFLKFMLLNKPEAGNINYICDYEGFRLADLVTYEHKRNETNGENNQDGTDYNLSWNCGIEGRTRKQTIVNLRNKQIKNALTILMMSQGTPMIFGGDEFGNSQDGNNNPYCQDNPTGWIDWSQSNKPSNMENLEYFKFLVKLKYKYRVFHEKNAYKLMDYKACGYPDISYHGTEAWRPDLSNYSHSIGMLYCGMYEKDEKDNNFFYVAYNMHWTPVTFALPKLPEGMKWHVLSDTEEPSKYKHMHVLKNQDKVACTERSIKILIGVGQPVTKKKGSEVRK